MYYNYQVNAWEYFFTVKALHWRCHTDVIQQVNKGRCPWKLGSSCCRRTGKQPRCKVILVMLLGIFTRITLHGPLQNTNSFIQSPGEEILCKRAASTDFLVYHPKICRNCVYGKFPYQEVARKSPHFRRCWWSLSGNQSSVSKDILVKSEFYMHFINILNLKLRNSIFFIILHKENKKRRF